MFTQTKQKTRSSLTIDQFFDELERTKDSFLWHLRPDTRPGSERRSWPRFWILALPSDGEENFELDPVEAVFYAATGRLKTWKKAAKEVGLSASDAEALKAAATDQTWRDRDGRRRPDEFLQGLRLRLLETINDRFILG